MRAKPTAITSAAPITTDAAARCAYGPACRPRCRPTPSSPGPGERPWWSRAGVAGRDASQLAPDPHQPGEMDESDPRHSPGRVDPGRPLPASMRDRDLDDAEAGRIRAREELPPEPLREHGRRRKDAQDVSAEGGDEGAGRILHPHAGQQAVDTAERPRGQQPRPRVATRRARARDQGARRQRLEQPRGDRRGRTGRHRRSTRRRPVASDDTHPQRRGCSPSVRPEG